LLAEKPRSRFSGFVKIAIGGVIGFERFQDKSGDFDLFGPKFL
jgi:hypothetical protein